MDIFDLSRQSDRTLGKVVIPSFGDKLATLLKNAGVKDYLDPEELNVMLSEDEEFTKWIQIASLDVLSPLELQVYDTLKGKVSEEEVNKCLFESLGNQEDKVCITQDIVDKALKEEEKARMYLDTIQQSMSYIIRESEKYSKFLVSLEQANEQVTQEKTQNWSSINDEWEALPEKWNEFLELVYLYLEDKTEIVTDSVNTNSDEFLLKYFIEMEHKLANLMDTIYQQLKEKINVGVEVSVILPRLKEVKMEEPEDIVKPLVKIQEFLERLIHLQQEIKQEILMRNLFIDIVLILCDNFSSKTASIAEVIEITNKCSREIEETEKMDITAEKLADMNQALTHKISLVTPENFISSLTNFASALNEAEHKCSANIHLLTEKHIMIRSLKNLIDSLHEALIKTDESIPKVLKYKDDLNKYGAFIHELKTTKEEGKVTKKKRLKDMTLLFFTNYDLYTKTLLEMKKTFELLSKACGNFSSSKAY